MIPTFPIFKPLEWSDREEVNSLIGLFAHYSDFNFVSLWSWDTRNKMLVSILNGNLVLLFHDYLTEQPFLSFVGEYNLNETVSQLLEHSYAKYRVDFLKLIPKEVAENLCVKSFQVSVDEDSNDYVISVAELNNQIFPKVRSECRRFFDLYPAITVELQSASSINANKLCNLFKQWAKANNFNHYELNEYAAFEKFIENSHTDNEFIVLYDCSKLVGFITYELLGNGYAVTHFMKGDKTYKGVYHALCYHLGQKLAEEGIQHWNFEQDLGLPGLRLSKRKYGPSFFLEKYSVRLQ